MSIRYTLQARQQLHAIHSYIADDDPKVALNYLNRIKKGIERLADFPFLGKVNPTFDTPSIREWVVLGYKIIYQAGPSDIIILAIYKHLDFDESKIQLDD